MTMLARTHAMTASQLIELKSISASIDKGDWRLPIFA
jgi:hypothetical protein